MTRTQRLSAAVAGIGLLVMAVLAGYANFAVIERAAQATPHQIDLATLAMGMVAFLDVVVGIGVWGLFHIDARRSAAVAAGLRVVYAALLAWAVFRLATTAGDGPSRALAFQQVFAPAIGLFGIHLIVLAWPVAVTRFASPFVRRGLAAAVAVCGLGYVIDEATRLLLVHGTRMATVTFIGEVALMFWLIILAARGRD